MLATFARKARVIGESRIAMAVSRSSTYRKATARRPTTIS
jgi:hypothetical protein